MSVGLAPLAQIEFNAKVKAAYQSGGKLRNMVRVQTGVTGSTHRFRLASRGVATPRLPQTDLVPMNTSYSEAIATLTDWNAAEYTDVFDEQKVNFSERDIVAQNIANAIDRRLDQMIIDALVATVGGQQILNQSAGMTYAKLLRISSLMDQLAVPAEGRKLVISARAKEDLLSDTKFISRDFVSAHYIQTGMLPQILGFDIQVIDNRDEGGLPIAATIRKNFAFHQQAVGLAIGLESGVKVDWIPEKTSWLANQIFTAGSVVIDGKGIVQVDTVET